jgi:hypothetical protein
VCISVKELDTRVANLRGLKVMRDELEANIKALELDVIGFLLEQPTPEYFGHDYKITYKPQSRTSLDKELLTSAFGDLSAYEKVSTFNVLRIK